MGSCIMGMLWTIASGFGMVDLAVQGIIRFVILDATMVILTQQNLMCFTSQSVELLMTTKPSGHDTTNLFL